MSETFIVRLAHQLDEPHVDPHDDPIPSADLETVEEPSGTELIDFDVDETVVIQQVRIQVSEILRYLDDHGIKPGTRVTTEAVTPIGMITVQPAPTGTTVSLPTDVARHIRARLNDEATTPVP